MKHKCLEESIVKLALTHISFRAIAEGSCLGMYLFDKIVIVLEQPGILASPRSLSALDPSQPKIPVNPRSQSAQDPSQPKIPVNPRSQSAQNPSQPKIPVNPRSQSAQDPALDALMSI